jgi:hypothetical protein
VRQMALGIPLGPDPRRLQSRKHQSGDDGLVGVAADQDPPMPAATASTALLTDSECRRWRRTYARHRPRRPSAPARRR